MTCTAVRQNCQPFLDGELDCAQRCALEHHLTGCEICRAFVDNERRAHAALKKATCDCACAPSDLAKRAFARLDAPKPKPVEPKEPVVAAPAAPPFSRRVRPVAAAAALVVCMLGGYALYCGQNECRWVVAAADTYDRIVQGREPVLQTSTEVAELRQAVAQHFPGAVVPCLKRCSLTPTNCGEIQIAGTIGHYVCYGDGAKRTALLVLKTTETPRGQKLQEDFVASRYANHSLYSWHTPDKQFLCILVSSQPLEQTLPLAETARAEFAAAPAR